MLRAAPNKSRIGDGVRTAPRATTPT